MNPRIATHFSFAIPIVLIVAGAALWLQDGKKKDDPKAAPPASEGAMVMPTPGPEHEMLMKSVGTWDVKMTMFPGPGVPSQESTGTEVNRAFSEFALTSEFSMQMGPDSFRGHAVCGYSSAKKKYYTTWVDTMSPEILMFTGDYDRAKKTLTMFAEGPDPMRGNAIVKSKSETIMTDDNHRTFKMYMVEGGKDVPVFTIEYTRKK